MTSPCANDAAFAGPTGVRLRRAQPLLGTLVELTVWHADSAAAGRACDAAFAALAEIERLMSYHRSASELSRLNRAPPGLMLDVTAHTWRVLVGAARVHHASGGLFDCAVAPRLEEEGFLPRSGGQAARGATQADLLLPGPCRAVKRRPLRFDLGGVAKGYAVDFAVATLRAAGARAGSVNAGGDIRVFGRHPLRVEVRDPAQPGRAGAGIALRGAAVATTAGYYGPRAGHRWRAPLVDPRSGACVEMDCSITVAAPRCALADALTKVIALTGDAAHPILKWILPAARRADAAA
jgi:thiamine biosynthesis lipoprotein